MKSWVWLAPLLFAGGVSAAGGDDFFEARLVKDINALPEVTHSLPDDFHELDGTLYFSAERPSSGREIFASDLEAPEARLVAELAPGAESSNARLLGSTSGRLVVSARARVSDGAQLWSLDPASGARTQLSAFVNSTSVRLDRIGNAAGRVFFTSSTDGALWATDGTASGTVSLLQDSGFLVNGYDAKRVCLLPDQATYLRRAGTQLELWRSDGTVAGTQLLKTLPDAGEVYYSGATADRCYFTTGGDTGWTLWRSDGTADGSQIALQSSDPATYLVMVTTPEHAYVLSGHVDSQKPLYRSDQTQPIATLPAGNVSYLSIVGDAIVYGVKVNGLGGTSSLTVYVLQVGGQPRAVQYNGAPLVLTSHGSKALAVVGDLVFVYWTGGTYRVDVATATAKLLIATAEQFPVGDSTYSRDGVAYGAGDGFAGREVWRSDGTPAGTRVLHDVNLKTRSSQAEPAVVYDNEFYFAAVNRNVGGNLWNSLWRSDGTEEGTQPLDPAVHGGGNVSLVRRFADGLVFTSWDSDGGRGDYRVDADFHQVQRIVQPGDLTSHFQASDELLTYGCVSSMSSICALRAGDGTAASVVATPQGQGGYLPIGALAGVHVFFFQGAVWRSDGTAPGTFRLGWLTWLSSQSMMPYFFNSHEHSGRLHFQACMSSANCGVYATDGTSAPVRIASVPEAVTAYVAYQGQFVFAAGQQLWRSGGTEPSTQPVASVPGPVFDIAEAGGLLHLIGSVGSNRYWVSDATLAGTHAVPLPDGVSARQSGLIAYDEDNVLFACGVSGLGNELCVADGAGNFRQSIDINPGQGNSEATLFARTADAAYVVADDGEHGRELWRVVVRRHDRVFANSFEAAAAAPRRAGQ